MGSYDFNCPQYVNFVSAGEEDEDSYFEVDHEAYVQRNAFAIQTSENRRKSLSSVDGTDYKAFSRRDTFSMQTTGDCNRSLPLLNGNQTSPHVYFEEARHTRTLRSCTTDGAMSISDDDDDNASSHSSTFQVNCVVTPHQKRRTTLPSPVNVNYNFRLTPARVSRLHVLLQNDPKEYGRAAALTPKHVHTLRSQMSPNSAAWIKRKKSVKRKIVISTKKVDALKQRPNKTKVKPFKFKTDERIKLSATQRIMDSADFIASLRHNSPQQNRVLPRCTKPQPFNLTQSKKRPLENGEGSSQKKFKTLAEQVEDFLHTTPARFRTVAQGTELRVMEHYMHQLVRPKSPKLQAIKRHRPVRVLSRQEEEELEIQKMRAYKFHAQPFEVHSPHLPKVDAKPPTKPLGIMLETEKRMMLRQNAVSKENSSEQYVFHAQEVPKNIYRSPQGIKEKPRPRVTKPQSPNFALKKRDQGRSSQLATSLNEANAVHFKANPIPNYNSPFVVKHEKKCTAVQPFSFYDTDQQRFKQKEIKILQEIENQTKVAEFHARPVPNAVLTPKPSKLPSVSKKQLTRPEPFSFTLERSQSRSEMEVSKLERAPGTPFKFKAHPASVIKKRPFMPQKMTRPIIAVKEYQLNTEKRAVERLQLKESRMSAEAEQQELLRQHMEEIRRLQQEELKRMRQETVHKANPIRMYKRVELKSSEKPLTQPCSPDFATNKRIKTKV